MSDDLQGYEIDHGSVVKPKDFRDSVGTIKESGSRNWIYPKKPSGKLTNYRTYVSWLLLLILFGLPFVKIHGNPILQLNIIDRQFFFFGNLFMVQDFYIILFGVLTTLVFIILFTVVFGRIFCGWICPQTIFMEMIFRKIEYTIEGDRNKQIRLNKQPWNREKILKKFSKWIIFFIISYLIAHTFLSYILGVDRLLDIIKHGPFYKLNGEYENLSLFIGLIIFTMVFFFVYAWFREQACTLVCPYGRLQGVLIDKKTILVAYDYKRGEPRGTWRKNEDRKTANKGDCIDCGQCVVVCPTGIDIRNGTQLECVNCTACIDACNEVMEKAGLPKHLIKYASEENIAEGTKYKFNFRAAAYSGVLLLLIIVFNLLIFFRPTVRTDFIQVPGANYVENQGFVYNPYQYNIMNKTNQNQIIHFKIESPDFAVIDFNGVENAFELKAQETLKGRINIKIPKKFVSDRKLKIVIGVYDKNNKQLDTEKVNFLGPVITIY